MIRLGVGGLWGTFGLLLTKRGWVGIYSSRTDRFVVLERAHGCPMVVTPEKSDDFVQEIVRAT